MSLLQVDENFWPKAGGGKMKKIFYVVLMFVLALALLAGCGSSNSGTAKVVPPDTETQMESTAEKIPAVGSGAFEKDVLVKELVERGFTVIDDYRNNVILVPQELIDACSLWGFHDIRSWANDIGREYVRPGQYSITMSPAHGGAIPSQPHPVNGDKLPEPKIRIDSFHHNGVSAIFSYWYREEKTYIDGEQDKISLYHVGNTTITCWLISSKRIGELGDMMSRIREEMYSKHFWGSQYYPIDFIARPAILPAVPEKTDIEDAVKMVNETTVSTTTVVQAPSSVNPIMPSTPRSHEPTDEPSEVGKTVKNDSPFTIASQGGILPVGAVKRYYTRELEKFEFENAEDFYESVGIKLGDQSKKLPGWHSAILPPGWNVSTSTGDPNSHTGSLTFLSAEGKIIFSVNCSKKPGDLLATLWIGSW